ncbi:TIM barrel protein [Saxibacter everestensis]|uniref:TIM barrel protein n=1 Tax=Saxibacter everestensis TaxID=2909229 RepID=A0ABY8QTG9_9MICO|nr:TIM barrel protein [Brevibacteriaceae bacterium ZFBP1038]
MSAIGLSSYAFFWQMSDRMSAPLTLPQALEKTRELGIDVFQICDYQPIEAMTDPELAEIRNLADSLGISLELGTKGIRPEHLRRFLHIAELLEAPLLRTMFAVPDHTPDIDEATSVLADVLPEFNEADVRIAIETYEQVPTADVLEVIRRIDDPRLGICSDPANTVAALEAPTAVIDAVAPHVLNMHVKDFAFQRRDGWVGFSLTGAPLGEGLLDYDYMAAAIQPAARDINQIIEHWLPWQGSEQETIRLENQWTQQSIDYLRSK